MGDGLSSDEVDERLEEYGYNELKDESKNTAFDVFLHQLSSILLWILVIASIISFFADKPLTFYFILVIIAIIVFTGFIQEWKAEKAMEALKKMASPKATVWRDGELKDIPSEEIVPDDVLKLEVGDKIPADAVLLDSINLKVDESILTGENLSVEKYEDDVIRSGTVVRNGRCEARVISTGMDTELGEIAEEVQKEERESPLQKKVNALGMRLGLIAIIMTLILFLIGFLQGADSIKILMTALALAVATVPEALPLTMTLVLSLGVKNMAEDNAIVRKMLAVEGLGSTTVICTDKTGTLTRNEMTVRRIYTNGKEFDVSGKGYRPTGDIEYEGKVVDITDIGSFKWLVKISALCNNADLTYGDKDIKLHGDPTEAALVTLVDKTKYSTEDIRVEHPRCDEILFTPERKRMTTINEFKNTGKKYALMKGAPEKVVERCKYYIEGDTRKKLTESKKKEILSKTEEFASQALRVLAFCYREVDSNEDQIETDMIYVGLVGMMDPPRKDVDKAISECKKAGIEVKMVTGDNKETAKAIAREIGLTDNPKVITGEEMKEFTRDELQDILKDVDIYARTHPENKLHIVEALQSKNEVVAMTGDGVNDAPAVKRADVGIGMGKKGTDVTKEASDIILEDDNFNTIVDAVKNGRRIYDNIEKFTTYLISRNFTEIFLIILVVATLGFDYIPLLALQILFLNVIGEETPALSLGVDPATKGIMRKKPRDPEQRLLHKRNLFFITSMALFMVLVAFIIFMRSDPFNSLELARTMTFATISIMIIVHSFNFRSLDRSVFEIDLFGNKWILVAILITTILVLLAIYLPPLQLMMEHVSLSLEQWIYAIGAALTTVVYIEIMKKIGKRIPKV